MVSISPTKAKVYSVKLMKSSRKSEYSVEKLASTATFKTRQQLLEEIEVSFNVTPNDIGYIEPGHGLKGKQRWLTSDADLTEMYTIYDKKKDFCCGANVFIVRVSQIQKSAVVKMTLEMNACRQLAVQRKQL